MSMVSSNPPSPTLVEDTVWIVAKPIGFAQYDFDFEAQFQCKHPYRLDECVTAIARLGTAPDYNLRYEEFQEWGISLINSPEQYQRSSYLPFWYPLIEEFTPRSRWYEHLPTVDEILEEFSLPIFIKGERQTNKHSGKSIIRTKDELIQFLADWDRESILWWQRLVCREYVELESVVNESGADLPKSYEFRSFWFRGELVGVGRYWVAAQYDIDEVGLSAVSETGSIIAQRLDVPFLVIDFARTATGKWIVIECNDGQDSGYAGVNPRGLWRTIIELSSG